MESTGEGRVGWAARLRRIDPSMAALVVVAVLATGACLIATRDRIGFETDSGPYLGAATNVATGRGVTTPFTMLGSVYGPREAVRFGDAVPFTDFPPLFPALVGGISALGFPLTDTARYLGAGLLGLNVVLVGLVFLAVTRGRARPLAVGVAALLVVGPTSPTLAAAGRVNWLTLHASMLSEPVFLTLVLGATLLVVHWLRSGRRALLVGAVVAAALAVLTRNVGVAFVVAASATILLRAPARRLVTAAAFGVVALVPTVAWSVWQARSQGALNGRRFAPRSAAGTGTDLLNASGQWLMPGGWPPGVRHLGLILVVLLLGVCALVAWRKRELAAGPVTLLVLFFVAYVGVLVVSRRFFDAIAIDQRMMAPLQMVFYVVGAATVWSALDAVLRSPRAACGAVLAGVVALALVSASPIARLVRDGFPGSSVGETIRAVDRLPHDTLVFSNVTPEVWGATGRAAYMVPRRIDSFTREASPSFDRDLAELGALAADRPLAIVLVNGFGLEAFPTLADLRRALSVRSVRRFSDGVVIVSSPSR